MSALRKTGCSYQLSKWGKNDPGPPRHEAAEHVAHRAQVFLNMPNQYSFWYGGHIGTKAWVTRDVDRGCGIEMSVGLTPGSRAKLIWFIT